MLRCSNSLKITAGKSLRMLLPAWAGLWSGLFGLQWTFKAQPIKKPPPSRLVSNTWGNWPFKNAAVAARPWCLCYRMPGEPGGEAAHHTIFGLSAEPKISGTNSRDPRFALGPERRDPYPPSPAPRWSPDSSQSPAFCRAFFFGDAPSKGRQLSPRCPRNHPHREARGYWSPPDAGMTKTSGGRESRPVTRRKQVQDCT